ncbi:MAG: helix-turn-helix transcriptional regulator [Tannerellaceae bacterium]|jgi:AraC-like DNA-binding protein|nr:helix-turn-helix transcriptional regulator [Tannerellaceae bacterium]
MNYKFAIKEPLSLRLYSPALPTGFRFRELEQGHVWGATNKDYHHLFFVLEGDAVISCNEFTNRAIHAGEFILIPIASDMICKALSPCRILLFSFEQFFHLSDRDYVHEICDIALGMTYDFVPATIRQPLDKFLSHILLYFKQGMNKPILHDIKHIELSIILRSFYTKEEVAAIFHPIAGKAIDFRIEVMRNYRKVAHVDDLAALFDMEKRTFGRQFKNEFGMSPYQWILNQKAKHVRFSLIESKQTLDAIRKEHGFKFPGHFTRFCREQFQTTPSKLVRSLRPPKIK